MKSETCSNRAAIVIFTKATASEQYSHYEQCKVESITSLTLPNTKLYTLLPQPNFFQKQIKS